MATSAVFTANATAGAYNVTATAGALTASFALTNNAGAAASIAATGGTPQSAAINTTFASALIATVKDAGNNPVSGVVVTFTAPDQRSERHVRGQREHGDDQRLGCRDIGVIHGECDHGRL